MNLVSCERCGKLAAHHDFTHYTTEAGTLLLCTQCFNADMAARVGINDFDNHPLEPISITGVDGVSHRFHFQTRLLGAMVTLNAFELKDGAPAGYQFQLIGKPGEDRYAQLGRMVQRIRSTLATKYLEDAAHGLQIVDMEVKGHIEADMSEEADLFGEPVPMLVIDGREVSWAQFGQMLMTFEGFQFKLQIVDRSDDVES
jgi:hypothetical protein